MKILFIYKKIESYNPYNILGIQIRQSRFPTKNDAQTQ